MKRTTVEALCKATGLEYAMLNSPPRPVHMMRGGGHHKVRRPDTRRHDLYVDLDRLSAAGTKERMLETLVVLAADLNCYEAGESLAAAGIVEATRDGRYVRREHALNRREIRRPQAGS